MDEFWSQFLQNLLMAVLPILATAAVSFAADVVRRWYAAYKNAQPDKAWLLLRAAEIAVQAAEQAGAGEYFDSKKEYALNVAENFLRTNGVKLDLDLIDAAIEAAVWEQFNKDKSQAVTGTIGFIHSSED